MFVPYHNPRSRQSDRDRIAVFDPDHDRVDRDRRSSGSYHDTPIAIAIAIRKNDDQAKNRDLDRDQNGDRKTLEYMEKLTR